MRILALVVAAAALAASGCGGGAREAGEAPPPAPATTEGEETISVEVGVDTITVHLPGAPLVLPGAPLVRGLDASARFLDARALAGDAVDQAELEDFLDANRFVGGLENEYTGRTRTWSHVVSRVLQFEDKRGAKAYLAWLDANVKDVLGEPRWRRPLAVGVAGRVFLDKPCGCHSDLPTYLGAWRRGSVVHTLLADGPGVDRATFDRLARKHDRLYGKPA